MTITLVVPMLLQMGWIEPPPYFCTVSETGRDVAEKYVDTPMVSLTLHEFVRLTEVNPEFAELPRVDVSDDPFNYMLEVYMDNYILFAIPSIWAQLRHAANGVTRGIHDVFLPDNDNEKDAISLKKKL